MNLFSLEGKTALVTGTSGGLGQGIAIGLAEAGANVVCVARGSSEAAVEKAAALGRKASAVKADLSDASGLQAVFDEALQLTGSIDILVNNAGTIRRTPAKDHSEKDWFDVIDLNLNSVFLLSQIAKQAYDRTRQRQNHQHLLDALLSRRHQRAGIYGKQTRRRRFDQSACQRMGRQRRTGQRHRAGIHDHG